MKNNDNSRVRRLKRRAGKLGAAGLRIVPHRRGTGEFAKEGWHLIDNDTNKSIAPASGNLPVSLDDIEAAIDGIEQSAQADRTR